MIQSESQAVLTFYQRGIIVSKGAKMENEKLIRNAGTKEDIRKIMAFSGAINPDTGKFERILNVDWYIKNKKPFPKKYFWAKAQYVEPTYGIVTRKLHWEWEQVQGMLNTPILMSEKQWNKLSDEQKIQVHATQCMLPGEYSVDVEFVI